MKLQCERHSNGVLKERLRIVCIPLRKLCNDLEKSLSLGIE